MAQTNKQSTKVQTLGINEILRYAALCEKRWEYMLSQLGSYERKTTFYADLSVAECYGIGGIKDTYNRVVKFWIDNVEYFTEFVMCLNHKCWEWYDQIDKEIDPIKQQQAEEISKIYSDLFYKARDLAYEKFDEQGRIYLYNTLD